MEEIKDKFLDDDLMEIFQAGRILQKSHSKLLKTSQTQHKGLEKMTELLKLAGESHEKQNEMQKQTDRLIVQQQSVIDNLISVKQENKQLKEQIQSQEENCVALQKEFELEKEDFNEQIRVMNEFYEEKINKINDANLEKEFKMKNDWAEIQKNWEVSKKQFDEKINDEKRNMAALNAEKNDVIKATIKKYEEQLRTLRGSLENAKHEQDILEKRNLENIKIHEKKMEDLEKHYIKMMEDVSKELKPTTNDNHQNLAGTSNIHSNLAVTSNNYSNLAGTTNNYSNLAGTSNIHSNLAGTSNNHSNLAGTSNNHSNLAGTSNTNSSLNIGFSKFNQTPSLKVLGIEDVNKQVNTMQIGGKMNNFGGEENKMAPKSWTKPTNFNYCQKNPAAAERQTQIKPILSSLSQFSNANKNQGGSMTWSSGSVQSAAKKMRPLQSFPEEASHGCHPLYAGSNQSKVTFAPNLVNSAKEPEPVKRVQFPTHKRKL